MRVKLNPKEDDLDVPAPPKKLEKKNWSTSVIFWSIPEVTEMRAGPLHMTFMEWLKKEALWHIQYIDYMRIRISIDTLYTLGYNLLYTIQRLLASKLSLSLSIVAVSVVKKIKSR